MRFNEEITSLEKWKLWKCRKVDEIAFFWNWFFTGFFTTYVGVEKEKLQLLLLIATRKWLRRSFCETRKSSDSNQGWKSISLPLEKSSENTFPVQKSLSKETNFCLFTFHFSTVSVMELALNYQSRHLAKPLRSQRTLKGWITSSEILSHVFLFWAKLTGLEKISEFIFCRKSHFKEPQSTRDIIKYYALVFLKKKIDEKYSKSCCTEQRFRNYWGRSFHENSSREKAENVERIFLQRNLLSSVRFSHLKFRHEFVYNF